MKYFLFISMFFSVCLFADANSEGKSFATEINSNVVNSQAESIDTSNFPNYDMDSSEVNTATGHYSDGINIENEAKSENNETTVFINNSISDNPPMTLSTNDGLFKREDEIGDLSNSLTSNYDACVDLPVGTEDITKYENASCDVTGTSTFSSFTCEKSKVLTCSDGSENYKETIVYASDKWEWAYTGYYSLITHNGGTPLVIKKDYNQKYKYSMGGYLWTKSNIRNGHILRRYTSKIRNRHILRRYKSYKLQRVATVSYCGSFDTTYNYSCSNGETPSGANLISSSCSEGNSDKVISGTVVNSDCWSWSQVYERESLPNYTRSSLCDDLEAKGCSQVNSECTNNNGRFCESETLTYECPYLDSKEHVTLCGSTLYCADGDCASDIGRDEADPTDAFKRAAASLAAAQEIADLFDMDNMTVFKGDSKSCGKKTLGVSNCCSDSGWGNSAGLSSCSAEEKTLGLLKDQGQVHKVGDYCSSDSLFGCIKRKYVYCSYPSKLSRIIIEQGKNQLGQGYGSAKHPNCSGFTLDELKSLDFDRIDLSEFYEEILNKVENSTQPNSSNSSSNIIQSLKGRYSEISESED